jgi:hypothetical protein
VIDSAAESGVPHGNLLVEFVEAVAGDDEARLDRARLAIFETLGPAALVDAAGAVASFNAVVKVADGVGLEVDDSRQEMAAQMRSELKLDFGPQ